MKNLFNKKIYITLGLFVFVFIGLFTFVNNKVWASGEYYYLKSNNFAETPTTKISFDTQEACLKAYNEDLNKGMNVISYCDPRGSDPVTVNGTQKAPVKYDPSSYKLLAPIGTTETIETNNIGKYFNLLFNIAIGLAGVLAVVMLVIGGIEWMGSESVFKKTQGKERITSAILGLIIAVGSYTLLNTINPDLLGRKGFNTGQVGVRLEQPILSDANTSVPIGSANSFPPECPQGVAKVQTEGGVFIACKGDVSTHLKNMIAKAKGDNIILSGGGFRTRDQQIQARKDNGCKDVFNTPPSDCKIPTAKPGTSMHEKGVAFDFTCDGKLISIDENKTGTKKSGIFKVKPETKKCFDWLTKNARGFGLYNLKSENWHWSINGK